MQEGQGPQQRGIGKSNFNKQCKLGKGPFIEVFEKKTCKQCRKGKGPNKEELVNPISTSNASWARDPSLRFSKRKPASNAGRARAPTKRNW
ncbi:hypothetical protein SD1155_10185 [Sulfitobacter donghicola]|nr:hypothetical protein SD1155_10185 [Sulfitobacter donghicola]